MSRVLVCVLVCLTGWIASAQTATPVPEEIDLLWQTAMAQPDDFGVACAVLDGQDDSAVLYNDASFPLASVSKLLILIAYAQRLEDASIAFDETVPVETLSQYNLPRTDRGAHDRFMAQYAEDVTALPLWDVAVDGMMQYSSNAAADYLLDRLAPIDWATLYTNLGIVDTDFPNSLTMIPLLMNNHDTGLATQAEIDTLSTEQGETYLDRYIDDSAWRADEITYRADLRRLFPSWTIQAEILQNDTATGTVNDFMIILRAIYESDGPLTEYVKYVARLGMRWTDNAAIDARYVEFGSKLGFYSGGTITLIAYGQLFNQNPVISVIFLRNVPQRTYRTMLSEDSIGNFAHWLNATACTELPALIETTLINGAS